MGWFSRMFGDESLGGWQSGNRDRQCATSQRFLERVAAQAGALDAVFEQRPTEFQTEMRATVQRFPLRIVINAGSLDELQLKYAGGPGGFDIAYEPDGPAEIPTDALPSWDEDGSKKVWLAPQILIEGSDADEEAARFHALPRELQAKVLAECKRLRLRYFRPRRNELSADVYDDLHVPGDPEAALADLIKLAVEVSMARGAVPPGAGANRSGDDDDDDDDDTAALARAKEKAIAIAGNLVGAKVVVRDDDAEVDVRWTEAGLPTRLILDHSYDYIEAEVRVDGVLGTFDLQHNPEVTIDKVNPADPDAWDELEHYVFFGAHVWVTGREAGARAEAAILHALPAALLDELVRTMGEFDLHQLTLDEELLSITAAKLRATTDGGARAIRVARLLARIGAALPRGTVAPSTAAVRCSYCSALWYPTPLSSSCTHCGAHG